MPEEKMEKDVAGVEEKERVVLVDDLVDGGDYWLSITDAARVTRRQEITIRRWISAGELPVRRQRMGANKRTRHVRASDLSTLTPIIDPLAAITGVPANADLMSIPLQQAQLLTNQQDFAQRLDRTEHDFAALVTYQERERQAQDRHHHLALDALRQEILPLLRTLEERVNHQDTQMTRQLHEQQGAIERAINELSHQLSQERALREDADQEQKTSLTSLVAQMSDIAKVIADMQAHTEQAQRERARQDEETAAQWHRQRQEELDQLRTHMSADMREHVAMVQQSWQQHLDAMQTQYESLQKHLLIEQQRRLYAETHLLRLRRQRRLSRRHQ